MCKSKFQVNILAIIIMLFLFGFNWMTANNPKTLSLGKVACDSCAVYLKYVLSSEEKKQRDSQNSRKSIREASHYAKHTED